MTAVIYLSTKPHCNPINHVKCDGVVDNDSNSEVAWGGGWGVGGSWGGKWRNFGSWLKRERNLVTSIFSLFELTGTDDEDRPVKKVDFYIYASRYVRRENLVICR